MSKKYFAKYLPVEGEIKEGDYWQHPKGAIFPYTEGYAKGPIASLKPKKVKLFLCSRDIQVGDKVLNSKMTGDLDVTEDILELIQSEPNEGWFKVVGEISPEARWIKEGDEFDKDDIEHVNGRRTAALVFVTIKIKCPCCNKFC